MIASVRNEIGRACDQFTKETGVIVTPTTRELAAEIISAIEEDPYPQWKVERSQLRGYAQKYISESQGFLRDIQKKQTRGNKITAFDLLHWLARDKGLESWLCLIPK
jgi:hypothetical protein